MFWMVVIFESVMRASQWILVSPRRFASGAGAGHHGNYVISAGQSVAVGPGGRLGPVPDAELGEDVGDVTFDGVHADPEDRGHLRVRLARGQQGQHLSFALAQGNRRDRWPETGERVAKSSGSPLVVQPLRDSRGAGRLAALAEQPVQAGHVPRGRPP